MVARGYKAGLAAMVLIFVGEPSWAAEAEGSVCPDAPPGPPPGDRSARAGSADGTRTRSRRRRQGSILRFLGLGREGSAEDAPLELPKLSLSDALLGAFGIALVGLLVGPNI